MAALRSTVKRLRKAMAYSRQKLEPFRRNRFQAVQQMIGTHYSDEGPEHDVPVNLLELADLIYTQNLAANRPQFMVDTPHSGLKPTGYKLQRNINYEIERIGFRDTLQTVVHDANLCMGIVKIGRALERYVELDGLRYPVGRVFCEAVDLDDWVHDMCATHEGEWAFCGNKYRVPLEDAKSSPLFDAAARAELKVDKDSAKNEDGGEKVSSVQREATQAEEYEDHVVLWDLYLPRERVILTLDDNEGNDKTLREQEWDGPDTGPYRLLYYMRPPDNVMPLAPIMSWRDLHDLANELYRKLSNQAKRQKSFTAVGRGGKREGEMLPDIKDGDVRSFDASKIAEVKCGSPDQTNLAFFIQVKDLYGWYCGNLDTLGGLSPQAETLGQEQILAASSSKRLRFMQERVVDFTARVGRDIAFYLWDDEFQSREFAESLPATGITDVVRWDAAARKGRFIDYNIRLIPHSLQDQTPAQKAAKLKEFVSQILLPLVPVMESQGMTLNVEGLAKRLAEYEQLTDLDDIVRIAVPQVGNAPVEDGGEEPSQFKPPVTKRTYERVGRPGTSSQGKNAALVNSLLGVGQQPAQAVRAIQ